MNNGTPRADPLILSPREEDSCGANRVRMRPVPDGEDQVLFKDSAGVGG